MRQLSGEGLPVALNYSGGTSSRWMLDAVLNGLIKRPEHFGVFFADTGDEHEWNRWRAVQFRRSCIVRT